MTEPEHEIVGYHNLKEVPGIIDRLREQLAAAQAEAAMLRAALEWYADGVNYDIHDSDGWYRVSGPLVENDNGRCARNALAQPSPAAERWAATIKVVEIARRLMMHGPDLDARGDPIGGAMLIRIELAHEMDKALDALAALTEKREEKL